MSLYRSGLRNPRTGRPWQPALARRGHQFVSLTPPGEPRAWTCWSCWVTVTTWQLIEDLNPRPCMGAVAQLKGETIR